MLDTSRLWIAHSRAVSVPFLHVCHAMSRLDVMDNLSWRMQAAYEKLYRWVQLHCSSLAAEQNRDATGLVLRALRTLQEKPAYFKLAIHPFVDVVMHKSMRHLCTRRFLQRRSHCMSCAPRFACVMSATACRRWLPLAVRCSFNNLPTR